MALIIQLLRAMATTANATTTVYTPSVSAVVSNIRVATTGTAGTVNVFLDPSGAAGPRRVAVKDKSLGVKELFVVKPEITMGPGDSILMIDWLPQHPCRPRFKWIAYVPLDAAPFYPPREGLLRDMEEVVAMSQAGLEFARTLHWDALMPEWLEVIRLASGVSLPARGGWLEGSTIRAGPGGSLVDKAGDGKGQAL